jgi:signal transduction histidine kinase
MTKYSYLFFTLFLGLVLFSQTKMPEINKDLDFEVVKGRVSKNFFANPKGTKKDAFLLQKIAKTNTEKNESYSYLGYIYDLTGNVDSARYFFSKKLNFSKKNFYGSAVHYQSVIDYCNWGMDYLDTYLLTSELVNTLKIIDENKNPQEKGLMYMLLGDVLVKDKEFEKAGNYYDKSFKLIKGKFVEADYYYRKGNIDIASNNFQKAKINFLKGLKSIQDKEIFAYSMFLNKLGSVSINLGELKKASQYLNESLHYQKLKGYSSLTSLAYFSLYCLAKKNKDNDLQKWYLDKAIETDKGDLNNLRDIYLAYKDYYSRNFDFKSELAYLIKYQNINDSIFNIERLKQKTEIESRYQLSERKKEIKLQEKIIQKDSMIKVLYLIGFLVLLFSLALLLVFYKKKIKTQRKLRENQNLLHEEQLKLMLENQRTEIIKEKIKSKLEERGKLSLELHDGIANDIGALKLSISNETVLSKQDINTMMDKFDKLYNEVRNLSHDLDPDNIADVAFSQLVDNLCFIIEKNGIKVQKNVFISKKIDDLEENILLNLYRILQEAFNNVIKHASASEVILSIIETETELIINVEDNGVGIIKNGIIKSGIGLKNIKKRVDTLKGKYEILSLNKGTSIYINIPKIFQQ